MRVRTVSILTLWIACLGAVPADDWLGRAQRDIAALPAETPKEFVLAPRFELAIQLYLTSPTDQRREFALSMLDQALAKAMEHKDSAEQVKMNYTGAALQHAKLGDFEGAKKLLALADQPSGVAPTTNPIVQMVDAWGDESRAEAYLLMGDVDGFNKLKLSTIAIGVIAEDLQSLGRKDLADVDLKAMDHAIDPFKGATTAPAKDDGWSRVETARDSARAGKFDRAMKAAAGADENLPANADGYRTDPGWYSFDAYAEVARAALRQHDQPHFTAAAAAAVVLIRTHPRTNFTELDEFTDDCATAGDRPAFEPAALALLAQNKRERRGDYDAGSRLAKLARGYAAVGDRTDFESTATAAEESLKLARQGLSGTAEEKKDRLQKIAMQYLWVAAARARASDVAGVNRDADLSRRVITLDGGYWDEPWAEVIHGYIAAGLLDDAVAALPQAKWDDDYGTLHGDVAWGMSKAGRWDQAWKLTAGLPTITRVRMDYNLTVASVEAHRLADVAGRVDGLKTPYEKGVVELAIAQALDGKAYMGDFRVFARREK